MFIYCAMWSVLILMYVVWCNSLFRCLNHKFFIVMFEPLSGFVMLVLFIGFMVMRSSYNYGGIGYLMFLLVVVLPMFFSLCFRRLIDRCRVFFGGLVPLGCPL